MQVTAEQLYATIGQQHVELTLLRAQNVQLQRRLKVTEGALGEIRQQAQAGQGAAPPEREAGET